MSSVNINHLGPLESGKGGPRTLIVREQWIKRKRRRDQAATTARRRKVCPPLPKYSAPNKKKGLCDKKFYATLPERARKSLPKDCTCGIVGRDGKREPTPPLFWDAGPDPTPPVVGTPPSPIERFPFKSMYGSDSE